MSASYRPAPASYRWLVLLFAVALAAWPAYSSPGPVHAATTLVVNSTTNIGSCGAGSTNYTLYCALNQANTDGSGDTIVFHFVTGQVGCAGTPPICRINLGGGSTIPALTASNTLIDGYSATLDGNSIASPNTAPFGSPDNARIGVQLDGSQLYYSFDGLVVSGSNNTIRGLSITGFGKTNAGAGNAISLTSGAQSTSIVGNFLGLTLDGVTPAGNNGAISGVRGTGSTHIGSPSPQDRNVIGGNRTGITLSYSVNNVIQGNYIGTDRTGSVARSNDGGGISTSYDANDTIGGSAAGAGNVLSGSAQSWAVGIYNSYPRVASATTVQGNRIGTNAAGTSALPNEGGIVLDYTQHVTVGGSGSAANTVSGNSSVGIAVTAVDSTYYTDQSNSIVGNYIGTTPTGLSLPNQGDGVYLHERLNLDSVSNNTIWNNTGYGVHVGATYFDSTSHVPITGNSFARNALGGIYLADQPLKTCLTGPTPNRPNDWLSCPLVKSATTAKITGEACAGCTVDVYLTPGPSDPEGMTFVGTTTADTCSTCSAIRTWTLSAAQYVAPLTRGQYIVAVATTPASPGPAETSEFSRSVPIGLPLVVTTTADLSSPCSIVRPAKISLRCAIDSANADGAGDSIAFAIPAGDGGCVTASNVCTIKPLSALPAVQAPSVAIQGFTQANSAPNSNQANIQTDGDGGSTAVSTVRLDGSSSPGAIDGLVLRAANDEVEGLTVVNFRGDTARAGIRVSGPGANSDIVAGNFVGLDTTGAAAANSNGIAVDGGATASTIGGRQPGDVNLISGNTTYGLSISQGSNHTVGNNEIGTNAAGSSAVPNGYAGIFLHGTTGVTIGGARNSDGNLISGNAYDGIDALSAVSTSIAGNMIGASLADPGNIAVPNGFEGVYLYLGNHNTVGSSVTVASGNYYYPLTDPSATGFGEGNRIEGNVADGLDIIAESADIVAGNTIGGLGNGGNAVMIGNTVSPSLAPVNPHRPQAPADATIGGNVTTSVIVFQNAIASNGGSGVKVGQAADDSNVMATVVQNQMSSNGALGISLTGLTSQGCSSSAPPGPNQYVPCPVIQSYVVPQLYVGPPTINGSACAGCYVSVYLAAFSAADGNYGEGYSYLGTAQAGGNGAWSLAVASGQVVNGEYLTATATTPSTDYNTNTTIPAATSMFSSDFYVTTAASPTAVSYSRLHVHRSTGRTVITWHGAPGVVGYNVYDGHTRLNRHLISSRTSAYRFVTERLVKHVRLVPLRR